ncbi:MAG: hypothetical protein M0R51_06875 [Clostridia bacterium]|jgi:hypothetical protein|nr:hypothetical protein [Clostridia bacterium]
MKCNGCQHFKIDGETTICELNPNVKGRCLVINQDFQPFDAMVFEKYKSEQIKTALNNIERPDWCPIKHKVVKT